MLEAPNDHTAKQNVCKSNIRTRQSWQHGQIVKRHIPGLELSFSRSLSGQVFKVAWAPNQRVIFVNISQGDRAPSLHLICISLKLYHCQRDMLWFVKLLFERERDLSVTGVDAYMKTFGMSENIAIDEVKKMVENAWKDINEGCLSRGMFQFWANYAKFSKIWYQSPSFKGCGDGGGRHTRIVKNVFAVNV
ncbi:terpenoid cyclases/protein prenyltransferase alpha-alpha toroid [Artemisia annua]|uniref:Terpenoid cyclases/protein prenyltransferase alpha-alpha toroid n=1 Tax=Artemisia annua TaxID=35608 RepID=A0A2U1LI99_ARTAN|nr:terpenoid cyclases/protein prenyltransferase alpha-alpha toroid [Artemisia annua]